MISGRRGGPFAQFSVRADRDENWRMHAARWTTSLVLTALAAAPATTLAAQQQGVPFPSPDGTRVVRLSLTTMKGNTGAPAVQIEYSMVRGSREILICPFATSSGGVESARYRAAWDEQSRRFAVLGSEATGRSASKLARLPSGEYVLLAHDRSFGSSTRSSALENDAWGIAKWKSAAAVTLPVKEFDLAKPQSEYTGRTGLVAGGMGKNRVQNLTVHANTQNFVPGRLAVTPTIDVFASQRAPAGKFEARLADTGFPTVLLAEGDTYCDQQWVVLHPLPEERAKPKNGVSPRLVWSQDGRYVLVVTAPGGHPGFAKLPGSAKEEVFLLFDVQQWRGTLSPLAEELGAVQWAK